MFKRLLNECTINLTLRPEGALLIKSGLAQLSGVDMAWVTVPRNGKREVYLPGSSLKGTIRSHAERIARTVNPLAACDPFEKRKMPGRACAFALEEKRRNENVRDLPTSTVYANSCPICRLFGNTFIMGRLATADAYAVGEAPEPQQRDGVGIDRFTGGASRGAKFELEVITGGTFATKLHLQNFELWQLGLIGFVLQDLEEGLVRMGSGKSRGLGKVVAEVGEIVLHYLSPSEHIVENGQLNVLGAGALFSQAGEYGMVLADRVRVPQGQAEVKDSKFSAVRQTVSMSYDAFPWQEVAANWVAYARSLESDPLEKHRQGGK
ncbi:MAG: hypothetical protein DKINENOH_04840 [bacterium]|nr:hypothetical protein [bacterium]